VRLWSRNLQTCPFGSFNHLWPNAKQLLERKQSWRDEVTTTAQHSIKDESSVDELLEELSNKTSNRIKDKLLDKPLFVSATHKLLTFQQQVYTMCVKYNLRWRRGLIGQLFSQNSLNIN